MLAMIQEDKKKQRKREFLILVARVLQNVLYILAEIL